MKKQAATDHPILEPIAGRWSPRAFVPEPVPDEALRSLFEAARWAASCFNEQPWAFVVARREDGEAFERALEGLGERNRRWAQNAGAIAFSFAKRTFERNGKPNRHAWHDVGQAAAHLALEAESRGLSVHQMAGIHPDTIRETYGVPEEWDPVAGIAIGKRGVPESLHEEFRESETSPRRRKPQGDFVFEGGWDVPAAW